MKIEDLKVPSEIAEYDPKATWTMRAINGVGISIEQMEEQAQNEIRTRRGVIVGMAATGPLVEKVKNEVQRSIDDGKIDGDQAKAVLYWLQRVREEIDTSVSLNHRELAIQEGIVEGFKKAVDKCELLFKQEENKTRVRMNEAERGNRDEGGRPRQIREIRDEQDAKAEATVNKAKAKVPKGKINKSGQ